MGIDRDRLVVPERQRGAGGEADPRKGDITHAGAVVPTASLQREGHAAGSVAPVGAGPPERRAGRELVTGRGGAAALGYPAAAALVLEVIPAAIQGDPVAFHRHAHGRVQPVDAMLAAEARSADQLALEPRLRGGPVLGEREPGHPRAVSVPRRRWGHVRGLAVRRQPAAAAGHRGRRGARRPGLGGGAQGEQGAGQDQQPDRSSQTMDVRHRVVFGQGARSLEPCDRTWQSRLATQPEPSPQPWSVLPPQPSSFLRDIASRRTEEAS